MFQMPNNVREANSLLSLGESPGLVVMGGESCTGGREFKSRKLDGYFLTFIFVKIAMSVGKRPKINEKDAGDGPCCNLNSVLSALTQLVWCIFHMLYYGLLLYIRCIGNGGLIEIIALDGRLFEIIGIASWPEDSDIVSCHSLFLSFRVLYYLGIILSY